MLFTKLGKRADLIIKIIILVLSYIFIAKELREVEIMKYLNEAGKGFTSHPLLYTLLVMAVIMVPVNLLLEALKWKLLVGKIEKISLKKSWQATLAGMNISFFTPNRIGEYFGRPFILAHASRWEGAMITMVGSMSQLLVTCLAGITALVFYLVMNLFVDTSDLPVLILVITGAILACSVLVWLYFRMDLVGRILMHAIPGRFDKFRNHLSVFSQFSGGELLSALFLSLLRYFVFATQFYLLIILSGLPLQPQEALVLISVTYLIVSAVPTIALSELGVRGAAIIFLWNSAAFSASFENEFATGSLTTAAMAVWLINLVLPSVAGGFMIRKLTFIREEIKKI